MKIHRHLPVLISILSSIFAQAQQPLATGAEPQTAREIHDLDPFVVNAALAPRSSRDMLTPTEVLAFQDLALSQQPTLGGLLEGLPGVHASSFGAGANRPVIRGLDGNRLRVMESGVDSGDLSADSPDHAVALEPFFVEQVEVLKGPSTLLYGSSAIGGVVNVIDKRIPRQLPADPVSFEALVGYHSGADGWTAAGIGSVQIDDFIVSFSYLDRDHGNYSIPGTAEREHSDEHDEHGEEAHSEEDPHSEEEHGHEEERIGLLADSFLESESASLAVSWFASGNTRLSMAVTSYDSSYGVPGHMHGGHEHAGEEHEHHEHHDEDGDHEHDEHESGEEEEGVRIDLNQWAVDFEFKHTFPHSLFKAIEARFRYVDYEHQELEGEVVGTDFDRESLEARVTASYAMRSDDLGAIGFQWHSLDSKAMGPESLTPESATTDGAVFVIQELNLGDIRLEGGARAEYREISVSGAEDYEDWAASFSFGAKWQIAEAWSVGALVNHSQRHPVATELYAMGPHAATRQFEIGDSSLGVESANGLDLSLHFHSGVWSASLTAFYTAFSDFIYAAPGDEFEDGLRVFRYDQVDVDFYGLEAEVVWHTLHTEDAFFDIGFQLDSVTTDISGSSYHLPRIPPLRVGTEWVLGFEGWLIRSSVLHSFEQEDTAAFEESTEAYTDWSTDLLIELPFRHGDWNLVIGWQNLLNEEIRPHTSPLKDLAPAPGRHLRVHLNVAF